MESFLQSIIDAIYAFGNWLFSVVAELVDAIFTVIKNAFIWAWDGVLGVIVGAVNSLSFSIPSVASYWAQVPADVINVLSLVGFGEAMAIVASAIVVRLGLQLIPFVRLGS